MICLHCPAHCRCRSSVCLIVAAAVSGAVLASCGKSADDAKPPTGPAPQTAAADAARDSILSPLETVARMREHRRTGRLSLVERSIVPSRRAAVSELLEAVDRLERASEALNSRVKEQLGLASAEMFDYSAVANIVGVFSRDVELIDQRIEGDTAVVTIQVAGRVPLDEVQLLRVDERWLITTDPPIPGLAAELGKLGDVWFDLSRQLEKQRLTTSELKRELDDRQAPITRRLAALTRNRQP